MRPAAILGLLTMIIGAAILASAIQAAFSTIPATGISLDQIDWGNVLIGSLLSISGGALINLATTRPTRATRRKRR